MRIRSYIVWLILLPVLAWGAVKGFVWYSLDATFRNAQSRISHLADISYGDVRTAVTGPIGWTGIVIRPKGHDDVIRIESLLVNWNKPTELMPILKAMFNKSLPDKLNLSAQGVALPLDSGLGDVITQPASWSWEPPLTLPQSIWGCGGGRFQSADYRAMQYERLNLSARLEYALSPATRTVDFYLRVRNPDMMSVSLEGSIPTARKGMPSLESLLSPDLKLARLSYTVDDESYNGKTISYCSEKLGQSTSAFVGAYIAGIAAELGASNLIPSEELTNAYRDHVTKAARITVHFNPFEPVGIDTLSGMEPENLVDYLGVSALADDEPIRELFIEREVAVEVEAGAEEDAKQREESFNPTPIANLGDHLSRLVRVRTNDGKTHYAYIEDTGPEILILTQHLVGGSATFELPYTDIVEVAVLY